MGLTWFFAQCMPAPYASSLHYHFVGTFHHAGANRPALVLELGVLHQPLSFAQIPQMLTHPFPCGQFRGQALAHTQEPTRTSMFEHRQTALPHLSRQVEASLL